MPTYEFTAFAEADLVQGKSLDRDAFDFSSRKTDTIDQSAGDEHEIEYDIVAGVLGSNPTPVPAGADTQPAPLQPLDPSNGDTFDLFF